jgi:hypothetical protein
MKNYLGLLLLASLFMVPGCKPQVAIDKNTIEKFARLPGKIGIVIKNGSGVSYSTIYRGRLTETGELPKAVPHAATILRENFETPTSLPRQKGYVYWGPYLASPDNLYMAASIAEREHAGHSPGFVVIHKPTNKTVAVVLGRGNRGVDALAWSPDSRWVATLMSSSELGELDRFFISLTGHADPKRTWYLDVVNLTGDAVAHTKLADSRGSWGWVVWLE